jgi:hypothetical protein
MADTVELRAQLKAAFDRFLDAYARYGGHRYYGWVDYDDPRNYRGPTFWSEDDCVYRLALELEREFPHEVHLELPVARWSFEGFDAAQDKHERVDLVVSRVLGFVESETSEERFMRHEHELFVEGKYLPAGCSKRWRADHARKVVDVLADAERLARHIERKHCRAAAVFVVDDDNLFEELRDQHSWPEGVEVLVASPLELGRRGVIVG